MFGLLNVLLAAVLAPQKTAVDVKTTAKTVERGVGVCQLPLAVGNCSREFPRFYFNADVGMCFRFTYSGCGGNGNRFVTKEQCHQRCDKNWRPGRTKITATFSDSGVFTDADCAECKRGGGACVKNACHCKKGFELVNKRCVDIDECSWENCPLNSVCKNTPGSFRCECQLGFAGSGRNCTKDPRVCQEPFDSRYEGQCTNSAENPWEIRFFFNARRSVCQRFWWARCAFPESNNFFNDVQSCEAVCGRKEERKKELEAAATSTTPAPADSLQEMFATTTIVNEETSLPELCLERFDERRRRPCAAKPEWRSRWFFDHRARRCGLFWFDEHCARNGTYTSRNVFVHESTCKRACEGVNVDRNTRLQLPPEHPHRPHQHPPFTTPSTPPSTSTPSSAPLATPVPTLATIPPIVRPPASSKKTVGVIQAMFTHVQTTSRAPLSGNEIDEEPTGRPLDSVDLGARANVAVDSKQWNTIVADGREEADHSLDIPADCLQPFDRNLSRSCSGGASPWRPRFYYDPKAGCRQYWSDGCKSTSKNDFEDLRSCQWQCERRTLRSEASHCLDEFDKAYLDSCRDGRFEIRYFFNHERKECELFYWGGCSSKSRNFFDSYGTCNELCSTASRYTTKACLQPFDPVYRDSCDRTGAFAQYYFFDQLSRSCRMFWFGNCPGKSENIFPDRRTCEWLCETKREQKLPSHCLDRFDESYRKPCNRGAWQKRWFFQHESGQCKCKPLSLPTEATPEAIAEVSAEEKETHRCFEPLSVGNCSHRLPAYFYNVESRRCEPFAFSGCKGNGNRWLTLSQCESTCGRFKGVKPQQLRCFQPLSAGFGRQNVSCIRSAGYRFYYNKQYGKCARFWFLGCGGNENKFEDFASCQSTCQLSAAVDEQKPLTACFLETDEGECPDRNETKRAQKFAYDSAARKCVSFEWAGCGGNANRFDDEEACVRHCGALKTPNSIGQCAHPPDSGPSNFLRNQWFFNLTSGVCEQFLYGGNGGNPNRFNSFELCMVTCQVPDAAPTPTDICLDRLDRGNWCEAMSNRYYYSPKTKTCKGFHYTGCGKSRNNFKYLEDCEDVCIHRRRPSSLLTDASDTPPPTSGAGGAEVKYAGVKPSERPEPEQHIILVEDGQRYLKSDGQWLDYGSCLGFRYNISGEFTRLKSFVCLMEEGGTCEVQTLGSTNGEERCFMSRPWMHGRHFYSQFFSIQRRPWRWTPETRRRPTAREAAASLLILPNDCSSIC
ncbi:hypothetical protein M3Y99_01704600 [Aphelenchoides fujianensis]|nr:hypothetical protein M3Y99_01704600 [Aphelenchoides fujianensis]